MTRTLVTTAFLLVTTFAAQARPVDAYYDLIRPNGHPRSHAIHARDLDYCRAQTGQSYGLDGPAMQQCMLGRGYRHMWGSHMHASDPPPPEPADVVSTPW
jgi:hypothetical protein